MSKICELVTTIRDKINEYPLKDFLLKRGENFSKLCSAMDTIEDTEEAIVEYLENSEAEVSIGGMYLRVYGLLQAIYVQQDSFRSLCSALDYNMIDFNKNELREARNNMVGHPTSRPYGINRPMTSNTILFEYKFGDVSQKEKTYHLLELIRQYRTQVTDFFQNIEEHLSHLID